MEIEKTVVVGTMESSDIMITLDPYPKGIVIDLNSTVEKQFGDVIRQVITECLTEVGIENAKVTAVDKGALDCTIQARVKAAAYRATECKVYRWGGKCK